MGPGTSSQRFSRPRPDEAAISPADGALTGASRPTIRKTVSQVRSICIPQLAEVRSLGQLIAKHYMLPDIVYVSAGPIPRLPPGGLLVGGFGVPVLVHLRGWRYCSWPMPCQWSTFTESSHRRGSRPWFPSGRPGSRRPCAGYWAVMGMAFGA